MAAKRPIRPAPPPPPPAAAAVAAPAPARYRVRSGGISTPAGTVWHGEVVAADRLGDAARVQQLLASRSIEEVDDGADG